MLEVCKSPSLKQTSLMFEKVPSSFILQNQQVTGYNRHPYNAPNAVFVLSNSP